MLGHGSPVKLAATLHAALAESKTPLSTVARAPAAAPPPIDLDTAAIDAALGAKGTNNGGVYQIGIPRAEPTTDIGTSGPPAMGYPQKPDLVALASAGDGSVRFFRGEDLAFAGSLALGSDPDNVRIDRRTRNIIVGYGSGGLTLIDPGKRAKIGDIKLPAHPESFQLDPMFGRVFVNLAYAGQIAVVDLAAARQMASWTIRGLGRISRWRSKVRAGRSP